MPVTTEAISQLMTLDRQMVVLKHARNAVAILTFLDGVQFDDAWTNRTTGKLAGLSVNFTSRDDYIRRKLATGRPKDLLEEEILEGH